MPLSVWKKLSLPELTSNRMTLKLADRSITRPKGVAEDVFIKVGKFHYPADFVVVDYDADPWVPLILRRPFLRTTRAIIIVYVQEVLGFLDSSKSGNPTPSLDPILSTSFPSLTPFESNGKNVRSPSKWDNREIINEDDTTDDEAVFTALDGSLEVVKD
ncbi:reverse transcriptase domain-containing protein [Tanacetum coccineum]|uniref:Reverse transcriptase domain-containing protein n=1 Tax=Tanacetum coccineum TaxID=301880 RepID=A0ABQ5ETX3_9ASTR